jgi:hypothetical protein
MQAVLALGRHCHGADDSEFGYGRRAANTEVMTDTVHVEAARIPDRDRLLQELRDAGLDAQPDGEIGIEVPAGDAADGVEDEVFAQAERVIMTIGAPFVPLKHEGVIYIRPPLS